MAGHAWNGMKPLFAGDGRDAKLLLWSLLSFSLPLYIAKEVEATAQLNQQTARISCVNRGELQQKPADSKNHSHV